MARRVLTVHEFGFREKGKRLGDGRIFAPSDLLGDDLHDVFNAWVSDLTPEETVDRENSNWVTIRKVAAFAPRVTIVELSVGSTGETGEVVNSETGESEFQLTAEHAPTGLTRVVLLVPETGQSAFFMSETSRRGSGGTRLRRLFESYVTRQFKLIKMDSETVSEGEAWVEHANLKEVELRVEGRAVDIADGLDVEVGAFSHIARPKRRAFFQKDLIGELARDKRAARAVVGLPTNVGSDREDVYVTLADGARQKKFLVDGGGAPSFRLVLNQDGQSPLTDIELVDICVSQLSELSGRTGRIEWNARWSKPYREGHEQDSAVETA